MIQEVYVVKDDLSGSYQHFGHFVNQAVAKRAFSQAVNADGVPASDLMLYKSGEFDTNTGVYIGYHDPEFIMRGEKNA